jgi:hypothetical protein
VMHKSLLENLLAAGGEVFGSFWTQRGVSLM